VSGYSGYSGSGVSGYSGSGVSGYSGAGTSGYSGVSGYSGKSGYSGSGVSGYSGLNSGYSGRSGYSGTSGYSGYSGKSGYSGSGVSGYSGLAYPWEGTWLSGTLYQVNDTVGYLGNGYVSIQSGVGQTPVPSGTPYWNLVSSSGYSGVAVSGLTGTKVYYVANTSGGTVTRKLTFINGILTSET
jgi:hypothetical protein